MIRNACTLVMAGLVMQGCAFIRSAEEMSCQERCQYDYHFCVEETPAGAAQVTFTFSPSKGGSDPLKENCAHKQATCIARCEGKTSPK